MAKEHSQHGCGLWRGCVMVDAFGAFGLVVRFELRDGHEEAGDPERQRPYVEVLRLALAGHPAPQAALGMPQPVAPAATTDRMRSQISTCWELAHTSRFDELGPNLALRQAVGLAKSLPCDAGSGLVSLTGSCAPLLAVLETRRGYGEEAYRHLRVASELARRLGADRNDYGSEFGPTNIALHQVAVEVELGNAAESLQLAGKVRPYGLSAERQARFLVDVARANDQRLGQPTCPACFDYRGAVIRNASVGELWSQPDNRPPAAPGCP